jgi:lipoyl(octanoyl) transferase
VGTLTCRLLPDTAADGPHNMATDEVLLEAAVAGAASLRFYRWSPPTLSLGYFQSEQLRHQDERLAHLPYVRRPSGGATLVHHHELTYAIALPAEAAWQTGASWLCRMHEIIAASLRELGIDAQACPAKRQVSDEPGLLCFHQFSPGDVLIAGHKIVGSAQRRQRRALLQHGAILLARSPSTPSLPGIGELTGRRLEPEAVRATIITAFQQSTGWELIPVDWTAAERQRIDALVTGKYTTEHWNRKR